MSSKEAISIFEIFKIGVGPSSSHTIGPWMAALDFVDLLSSSPFDEIRITLYGSLSKTGKGHATDKAIQLGLLGYKPHNIDTSKISKYLHQLQLNQTLLFERNSIVFDPNQHIIFSKETKPDHPNTLIFESYFQGQSTVSQTYFSVGGGFIQKPESQGQDVKNNAIYSIQNGSELLDHCDKNNLSIAEVVMANELSKQTSNEIESQIDLIFSTMKSCVFRGCSVGGILPGGLKVKRRAYDICKRLLDSNIPSTIEAWESEIRKSSTDFNKVSQWISCFALAVNEENAAMGRVVTSPTNGAAGVIPAVLLYYTFFVENNQSPRIQEFLLTAGQIGALFKLGATISAAVGGCQAEIGVSSSMAAGALTAVLGGTPEQVLMAAEIAMEHHLGLTCDPVGGLVQIPCIERNAMGAMKAITAAQLAISGDPAHSKVKFDTVVKSMWDTAQEMNSKYKETSEGGLAFNIPVISPEC